MGDQHARPSSFKIASVSTFKIEGVVIRNEVWIGQTHARAEDNAQDEPFISPETPVAAPSAAEQREEQPRGSSVLVAESGNTTEKMPLRNDLSCPSWSP